MRISIRYLNSKIKLINDFLNKKDIFLILLLILTSIASFGLGRLSKIEENKTPIQIEFTPQTLNDNQIKGEYVASKNGSKYYLPWCSGVKKISENNKVWFNSKKEAKNKGYTPATNCKGI